MKYQIFGDKLPIVTLQFEAGESIYTWKNHPGTAT